MAISVIHFLSSFTDKHPEYARTLLEACLKRLSFHLSTLDEMATELDAFSSEILKIARQTAQDQSAIAYLDVALASASTPEEITALLHILVDLHEWHFAVGDSDRIVATFLPILAPPEVSLAHGFALTAFAKFFVRKLPILGDLRPVQPVFECLLAHSLHPYPPSVHERFSEALAGLLRLPRFAECAAFDRSHIVALLSLPDAGHVTAAARLFAALPAEAQEAALADVVEVFRALLEQHPETSRILKLMIVFLSKASPADGAGFVRLLVDILPLVRADDGLCSEFVRALLSFPANAVLELLFEVAQNVPGVESATQVLVVCSRVPESLPAAFLEPLVAHYAALLEGAIGEVENWADASEEARQVRAFLRQFFEFVPVTNLSFEALRGLVDFSERILQVAAMDAVVCAVFAFVARLPDALVAEIAVRWAGVAMEVPQMCPDAHPSSGSSLRIWREVFGMNRRLWAIAPAQFEEALAQSLGNAREIARAYVLMMEQGVTNEEGIIMCFVRQLYAAFEG
jgi:hypothetical protein